MLRIGSRAPALGAAFEPWDLDLGLDPEDGVFKGDPQVITQIGPPSRLIGASAAGAPEHIPESEEVTQDVAEIRENIGIEAPKAAGTDVHAGVPEAVVLASLGSVAQHAVGFSRFLEILLGVLIAGILVRMVPDGQLSIGALDLLRGGIALYAQNFVIVSLSQNRFPRLEIAKQIIRSRNRVFKDRGKFALS